MVARSHHIFVETRAKQRTHALATDYVNLIGLACGIGATNPDCAYGPEALNPELNHYQITAKVAIEILIEGLVKV